MEGLLFAFFPVYSAPGRIARGNDLAKRLRGVVDCKKRRDKHAGYADPRCEDH